MRHYKLVMPGDLNHYGYLFGGHLLKWVDEFSWITATQEYPGRKFVTIAMDQAIFKKGADLGNILLFDIQESQKGKTSIQYEVTVFRENIETGDEERVFSTHVRFVCLDEDGNSTPID
jgi:acyl-CoA hydrolase